MKRAFAVVAVLVSVTVFAQTEKPKAPSQDVIFGDSEIKGGVVKPTSEFVFVKRKPTFGNMIKVRGDFQPELEKSADGVK